MWITTCRYRSPSWRADSRLARQEIHCNVWSPKLSHRIHNSPPPICASLRGSSFPYKVYSCDIHITRLRLKCDGTRAETKFRLSAKRTSPFKSVGASVQSTTGSRGVRISGSRGQLKCDGTSAETRFRLSAKPTSPFKSAGVSVQSAIGSRGVRISGSNAGYTMFRGSVRSTGYPHHSPGSPSFPLPCVTVCHHISTGLYNFLMYGLFCRINSFFFQTFQLYFSLRF